MQFTQEEAATIQNTLCGRLNKELDLDRATPYKIDLRCATRFDPHRNAFQRDRDRIIHSKSFRRLERKTQTFSRLANDHIRTRLTHTLEVFEIADGISRRLGLNLDLVAAISLGHDLGHTPCGHAGERALNSIGIGLHKPGYKHNLQTLKIVNEFEGKGQRGLELTLETRDGIVNHTGLQYKKARLEPHLAGLDQGEIDLDLAEYDKDLNDLYTMLETNHGWKRGQAFTIEGQVVALADEIAQKAHDLDDAIRIGIINVKTLVERIRAQRPEWEPNLSNLLQVADRSDSDADDETNADMRRETFISYLIGYLIDATVKQNEDSKPRFIELEFRGGALRVADGKYVDLTGTAGQLISWLDTGPCREFLNHFEVRRLDARAKYMVEQVFKAFWRNPAQMHTKTYRMFENAARRCSSHGCFPCVFAMNGDLDNALAHRDDLCASSCSALKVIINTISGMTDNYFYQEYENLYLPPRP